MVMVPLGGLEPPPHGLRARYAALTLQRVGAATGSRTPTRALPRRCARRLTPWRPGASGRIRTGVIGLEARGPPAGRHSRLVRPTGIEPVPPRWQRGMRFYTQAEHGPAHRRPRTSLQLSKNPLTSSWWAARDSNPSAPFGRTGLRPVSGPSARTARLATAPGFEPGPESFGGSDASATPRCRLSKSSVAFEDRTPLCLAHGSLSVRPQNKKAF